MNKNLTTLLKKIIQSNEIQNNLKNQKNLDEAYSYCLSIQNGYEKEEFEKFLKDIVYLNNRFLESQLDEESLAQVSGGALLDPKKELKIVSALLGSAIILQGGGLLSAQGNFDNTPTESSISVSENAYANEAKNIINNLSESSKEALNTIAATAEKLVGTALDATSPKLEAYYPELDDYQESSKQDPTIYNWPTISELTVGQSTNDIKLSGGDSTVPGKFEIYDVEGNRVDFKQFTEAGNVKYLCKFIPKQSDTYNEVSTYLFLKVSPKEVKVINAPSAKPLVYGQTLSESNLSGGNAEVPGIFVWKDIDTIPRAGTHYYDVNFVPSDKNCKVSTIKVRLEVQKASPVVNAWPTAADMEFGDKLEDCELSGGTSNVPGKFVWSESQEKPKIGTQSYTVLFKPYDSENYFDVYNYVQVNVLRAYPKIYNYPSVSNLHYGQSLSDAKFGKGYSNVKGKFSWKKDEKNLKVGTHTKTVIFTPDDSEHYVSIEFNMKVKVEKAPVKIYNSPEATSIVYGESLSKSKISKANSSVPGAFMWVKPNERPDAGQKTFEALFVPFDRVNYKTALVYVPVTIQKSTPKLSNHNIEVSYSPGLTLKDISLPKGWFWEMPNQRLERVGNHENLSVKYNGDANNNSAIEKVVVHVNKAEPNLSIKPVFYEKNKTVDSISLPKGWRWDNPKELLLTDKSIYSASYNSEEAGTDLYYDRENVDINITVNKSEPKISKWPRPEKDLVFGDDTGSVNLIDSQSETEGTFKIKEPGKKLYAGTHMCKVVFEPSDKGYKSVEGYVSIKVNKNMNPLNVPEIKQDKVERTENVVNLNIEDRNNDYEYSKDGGLSWQNSSKFTDLTPKTEYKFVYRYRDNDSHCAGKLSKELKISTKDNAPAAPTEVKVKSKTNHKIVFEKNDNLEYSKDSGNTWQDSPEFDNLSGRTEYEFIARVKETDEHVAGDKSDVVKVKTYSWVSNIFHKIFG